MNYKTLLIFFKIFLVIVKINTYGVIVIDGPMGTVKEPFFPSPLAQKRGIMMTAYEENPYKRQNMNSNKRRKRRRKKIHTIVRLMAIVILALIACYGAARFITKVYMPEYRMKRLTNAVTPDYVEKNILDYDSNSRSGEKLEDFKGIVVHYVGNPGTSAQANHNYFANPESNVASHFIIGLNGEIIQCLPLDEKSAASNWRNNDTISIEVCHPDDSGAFTAASYNSLVKLTKWLVELGKLNSDKAVIRHYDITGKECPKYYVDNPEAWDAFKDELKD